MTLVSSSVGEAFQKKVEMFLLNFTRDVAYLNLITVVVRYRDVSGVAWFAQNSSISLVEGSGT